MAGAFQINSKEFREDRADSLSKYPALMRLGARGLEFLIGVRGQPEVRNECLSQKATNSIKSKNACDNWKPDELAGPLKRNKGQTRRLAQHTRAAVILRVLSWSPLEGFPQETNFAKVPETGGQSSA